MNVKYEISKYWPSFLGPMPKYYIYGHNGEFNCYLHSDNIWRKGTTNEEREYTGFFSTKQEAENAVIKNICGAIDWLSAEDAFAVCNAIYHLNHKNIDAVIEFIDNEKASNEIATPVSDCQVSQ